MQHILEKLYSLHQRGIKPGLERVEALLAAVGNPHRDLRAIHIAGTNGKGTVSSIIASVLAESGEKVGLYTSPHLRSFNERIRINGQPISNTEVIELYNALETTADQIEATFFEITTVMAFLKFKKSSSLQVIECGLGGRLDSTNVIVPTVAVITSIDYDHQEWLGNTLEQIALEKAGIFKPNVPAVVGETRDRLKPVFSSHAHSVGVSRLIFLDDQDWIYSINSRSTHGMTLSIRLRGWSFDNLFVPLHGEHQVRNLAIALLALQEHWGTIPPADTLPIIERGLRNLRRNSGLRGRIETVRTNPLLVVDVAHNEAGCQALVKTIGEAPFPPKWNVVFGVMRDKDYREMLAVLSRIAIRFFFATPRNPRACSAEELAEQASSFGIPIAVHSNIGEAFLAALQLGEPVVCTGSFFTIEEVLDKLDELGDNVSNSHS